MIIDCHCHAGKGDLMTAPWNTDAPIEPYLRRARAAGIQKTIVFAPFHSDYAEANAEVAKIVARYPGRLMGFAFVHASRDTGRIYDMVRRAVAEWHFRGIKVHGHDAMPTQALSWQKSACLGCRPNSKNWCLQAIFCVSSETQKLARPYLAPNSASAPRRRNRCCSTLMLRMGGFHPEHSLNTNSNANRR
jgi:hypothetical protein